MERYQLNGSASSQPFLLKREEKQQIPQRFNEREEWLPSSADVVIAINFNDNKNSI